jgi:hypothetical protein
VGEEPGNELLGWLASVLLLIGVLFELTVSMLLGPDPSPIPLRGLRLFSCAVAIAMTAWIWDGASRRTRIRVGAVVAPLFATAALIYGAIGLGVQAIFLFGAFGLDLLLLVVLVSAPTLFVAYTCAAEARRAWRLVGPRWMTFAALGLTWGAIVALVVSSA